MDFMMNRVQKEDLKRLIDGLDRPFHPPPQIFMKLGMFVLYVEMQTLNTLIQKSYDCCCKCAENKIGVEMNGKDETNNGIYHEKQVKQLCALHALNNLFQKKDTFNKAELDSICQSLSPDVCINPHRSLLGLGNYDVNVIMAALQVKGFEAIWFDKRKDPMCLRLDNICGFILNVPSDYKLGFVLLPLRRRHWIAIRQVSGVWYNLDSKLEEPHLIGNDEEMMSYLRDHLQSKEKELFIIVSKEVESSQLWQKESNGINR